MSVALKARAIAIIPLISRDQDISNRHKKAKLKAQKSRSSIFDLKLKTIHLAFTFILALV
jgi:hypothetical protein